jgi:ion channel POLLUX/CASTOR
MRDDDERPAGTARSSLRERVRYRFDNMLARGTWAALLLLGIATLAAVTVSGLLLRIFGVTFTENENVGWFEDTWQSLLRVMDTGTMAGDIGWGRRILALAVTIFGILVAGTLIGILAAGVDDRISRLRRGRSVVIESGHVVVLGPSDRIAPVVRELVRSGAGARGGIVVMADDDPADMRNEVRALVDVPRDDTLVFRSGDPTRPADLELVRLAAASKVIVVADVDDAAAVRTTLALLAATNDQADLPIIVETHDPATAASLTEAGGPRVLALATDDALARIAAYAVAHPGMAGVIAELTDPRSADLQVNEVPDVTGTAFRDLVLGARGSRPLGWFRADGTLLLNPPPDTPIGAGDRIVHLAVDDAPPTIVRPEQPAPNRAAPPPHPVTVEHLVVLGWSPLAARLVESWAGIASAGSTLEIVGDPEALPPDEVVARFGRVPVTLTPGDIDDLLAQQDQPRRPTVILMPAQGDPSSGEATDSATILRLMPLRRRLTAAGSNIRLMVELLDPDSTALVPPMGIDDHVMSREMAAQLIVQLAEQPARRRILAALHTPDRPSLRLVSAAELGLAGDHDMGEVVTVCESRGLLAIGLRRSGVVDLDPGSTTRALLAADDQIVVVD